MLRGTPDIAVVEAPLPKTKSPPLLRKDGAPRERISFRFSYTAPREIGWGTRPDWPKQLDQPVVWYSAKGYSNNDKFLVHGGFFATLFAKGFSYDPTSRTISFTVEHTAGHSIGWSASAFLGSAPELPHKQVSDPDPAIGAVTGPENSVILKLPLEVFSPNVEPFYVVVDLHDSSTNVNTKVLFTVRHDNVVDVLP